MALALNILLGLFAVLCFYYYQKRKQRFKFFKERGIPGPEPNIIIGNLAEVRDGLSAAVRKWGQTYGQTYGFFEGPTPVLVTSDKEILRQVFIKDYPKFAARKRFAVQSSPDAEKRVHLFFSDGERWKRQRTIMNKAFSAQRLRMMTPALHNAVRGMMNILDHKSDDDYVDMYPILQCLTLQVIMSVGFGVDFDAQRDNDNIFLRKCRSVFTDNMPTSGKRPFFGLLVILAIMFPSLNNLMFKLQVFLHENNIDPDSTLWFMDAAGEIINRRRTEKQSKIDFIQLMLDAELDSDSSDSQTSEPDDDGLSMTMDPGEKSPHDTCPMIANTKKFFTFEEMKANCQLFLLAGYETTSTGLAYIFYELALNQECQDIIYKEISTMTNPNEMTSYQEAKSLKYLDMFVFETFRLHPIAPFVVGRTALEETTIKGIHIPKGQAILANVFDLQFNEECWEEPEKFKPERFEKEQKTNRDPLNHLPFGIGPRNCLGIRFAMYEIRVAVAEILRKFRIMPCEKTEVPLQTSELATIVPKHGIPVKLKLR